MNTKNELTILCRKTFKPRTPVTPCQVYASIYYSYSEPINYALDVAIGQAMMGRVMRHSVDKRK